MKMLLKRFVAFGLAVMTILTLCVTANAASTSRYFVGQTGYKLTFKLSANAYTVASAAYRLEVDAEEIHNKPYYYLSLYVKGVLYGRSSENSVNDKTFSNAYKGNIIVSRGTGDCDGYGFGNFHAYGNDNYGEVYGTVNL